MPSEKDRKENTGAKPQHEPYGSRQAHAPQAFYCSPKDSEELKTVIFIANDNTSKTPNADRWFIEGVFATLRHLTKDGGKNAESLYNE